MPNLNPFDPKNRKMLVVLAGGAVAELAVVYPALPENWKPWATAVLWVATALGMWKAKNAPAVP